MKLNKGHVVVTETDQDGSEFVTTIKIIDLSYSCKFGPTGFKQVEFNGVGSNVSCRWNDAARKKTAVRARKRKRK